jgi:hypothetical protein
MTDQAVALPEFVAAAADRIADECADKYNRADKGRALANYDLGVSIIAEVDRAKTLNIGGETREAIIEAINATSRFGNFSRTVGMNGARVAESFTRTTYSNLITEFDQTVALELASLPEEKRGEATKHIRAEGLGGRKARKYISTLRPARKAREKKPPKTLPRLRDLLVAGGFNDVVAEARAGTLSGESAIAACLIVDSALKEVGVEI